MADELRELFGDTDPTAFWLEMGRMPAVGGESARAILRRAFDETGRDRATGLPVDPDDLKAALQRARGAIARVRAQAGKARLAAERAKAAEHTE